MNDQPTLSPAGAESPDKQRKPAAADRSRRHTVQKFAAFLAHLFNGSDQDEDVVVLNYGDIFQRVTRLLEANPTYHNEVAGARYCMAEGWDEANVLTSFYFDRIIDRPLGINRGKRSSVTFDLLLSMLQRCASEAVAVACLEREESNTAAGGNVTPFDPDMRELLTNMGALLAHAAPRSGAYDDPPVLRLGGQGAELPQTLSVWQAATAAPRRIRRLEQGPVFLEFCSRVINAVETANRPSLELLNIGLCPGDWLDEVPLNQLRAIGRLIRRVLNHQEGDVRLAEVAPNVWAQAWAEEPVPKFDSVEDFLASPMAQALTGRATAVVIAGELPEDDLLEQDGEASDPEQHVLCGAEEFARLLALAREANVIEQREAAFMRALFEGEPLAALAEHPEYKDMIGKQQRKVDRFVAGLQDRLLEFAGRQHSA